MKSVSSRNIDQYCYCGNWLVYHDASVTRLPKTLKLKNPSQSPRNLKLQISPHILTKMRMLRPPTKFLKKEEKILEAGKAKKRL